MRIFLLGLLLSCPLTAVAAAPHPAQSLYDDYCSVCHGDSGDGNSHARQGMNPPPRDFTTPLAAQQLDRARIRRAIRDGVPGTAMSAWKARLDDAQVDALADLILTRFIPTASAKPDSEGARIYAEYCSVCHGDDGKGAVWATAGLSPAPADFTAPKFQAGVTRAHMIQSVTYGRPETAMTGWKTRLEPAQIEAVVDHLIDTFMPEFVAAPDPNVHVHADGHTHRHASSDDKLAAYLQEPLPEGLSGDPKRGGELYRQNCAACHGESGDGKGPRAYFIFPKPRNFLHAASRASLNRPKLYDVISHGKLRTEMPAWDKVMDAQQIADISEYVYRSFIQP